MTDVIKSYRFNHRLLDQLNTGFHVYMPALNHALRKESERSGDGYHGYCAQPARLQFEYVLNYTRGCVTINIYFDGQVAITETKSLPCCEGGSVVVRSVMDMTLKSHENAPEEARISAAGFTVIAIEGLCADYLRSLADKIAKREHKDSVFGDRYALCYMEDAA